MEETLAIRSDMTQHGWKLTDEGGEKGKARCAALAPHLLQLLCLTKNEII
jgi:hypothetical protein